MKLMGPDATILVFWMLSLKPAFPLSSFTFIKRLFSSSLLFLSIIVVSSVYLRLLMFLYTIWFQLVIVPHDFRLFRQCTYSNSVSLHSATYIGPFLCPITRKKSGEMRRFFLSKKSMTCCRVADSKKEQGLSPFSYMQKKKILELFVYPILATLPMGFSWQEYWNGSPCIPSENLLDPPRDQIWDSCISCGAGMLFPEPVGSPSAFCYFLEFDPSRIRVELAERSFMTKMDRYTTVNW